MKTISNKSNQNKGIISTCSQKAYRKNTAGNFAERYFMESILAVMVTLQRQMHSQRVRTGMKRAAAIRKQLN